MWMMLLYLNPSHLPSILSPLINNYKLYNFIFILPLQYKLLFQTFNFHQINLSKWFSAGVRSFPLHLIHSSWGFRPHHDTTTLILSITIDEVALTNIFP
ncbi:hypothetical protein EYC80_005405 [Monilinia laxa]|uniref:Uncharacterized protein n=1 Tax=Monilinia laxa TaxID=61186 RepID=A0A5N6KK37_MONLA|nr:hypothetical protein EYC80_005405 [Monilinia laxa]